VGELSLETVEKASAPGTKVVVRSTNPGAQRCTRTELAAAPQLVEQRHIRSVPT
ncbi:unnamed protein product, partial [Prorocentrum cordatum]